MIRRHVTVLRLSLMAGDALVAAAVFAAVSAIRFGDGWVSVWERIHIPAALGLSSWAVVWVTAVWVHGLYRLRATWSIRADIARLIRVTLLVGIAVFMLLFAVQLPQVSRLFLVALFAAQLVVSVVLRFAIRGAFAIARLRGLSGRNVLVVGTSSIAHAFADMIESHRELGLRVLGHVGERPPDDAPPLRRPVLGDFEDIESVLHSRVVDEVAICLEVSDWPLVEALTKICAEEGKIIRVPADGHVPRLPGAAVEQYGGLTIQSLVYGPDRVLSLLAKRIIDLVGAALLLLLTAPLTLGLAVAIRVTSGSPVLFRQARVGLHGREFQLLKFRTMVPDAEAHLERLLEHNEVAGPAFKLTDDPRVSPIGRFLRRTSLDELPQLWNVLRGDMSLVGPRPPLPREVAGYDVWHRRRLSMKPGITGLWQVTERRNPDFDRWVSIDLDYIDRWSLWLDIKILFRTIPAMLEGR